MDDNVLHHYGQVPPSLMTSGVVMIFFFFFFFFFLGGGGERHKCFFVRLVHIKLLFVGGGHLAETGI